MPVGTKSAAPAAGDGKPGQWPVPGNRSDRGGQAGAIDGTRGNGTMAGRRADRADGSTGLFGQGIKTPPTNTGKTPLFLQGRGTYHTYFYGKFTKSPRKGAFLVGRRPKTDQRKSFGGRPLIKGRPPQWGQKYREIFLHAGRERGCDICRGAHCAKRPKTR